MNSTANRCGVISTPQIVIHVTITMVKQNVIFSFALSLLSNNVIWRFDWRSLWLLSSTSYQATLQWNHLVRFLVVIWRLHWISMRVALGQVHKCLQNEAILSLVTCLCVDPLFLNIDVIYVLSNFWVLFQLWRVFFKPGAIRVSENEIYCQMI